MLLGLIYSSDVNTNSYISILWDIFSVVSCQNMPACVWSHPQKSNESDKGGLVVVSTFFRAAQLEDGHQLSASY